MGRCEMNGWLSKGQIRRKKYYYRLQGPFLSEHDDEVGGLRGKGEEKGGFCSCFFYLEQMVFVALLVPFLRFWWESRSLRVRLQFGSRMRRLHEREIR